MSGIKNVRGKGKLEIIFIGSNPPGGGTALQFGYSCAIVRKLKDPPTGGMTNILVNYGSPSENFDIVQAGLEQCPNPQLDIIKPDDIDAILPTSLAPNHIDKIPNLVQQRNPNKIKIIVDSQASGVNFLNAIAGYYPPGTNINSFFQIVDINTLNGDFDDIGIDYNSNGVTFDDRILYSNSVNDVIGFYRS